jgi:site-specific recombinase XerD
VELALATGLRVMEVAGLKCGDVFATGDDAWLVVRRGKGGRRRIVRFGREFQKTYRQHLHWKQAVGEATCAAAPLLVSSNTGRHLTTRAIQKAFKRCAARAGLPDRYSIHCLRHTYACALYKAGGYNLRLVQKQLGHARISTTQVYADVMDSDVRRALERLYRRP